MKVKNSLLELGKDLTDLKYRELNEREVLLLVLIVLKELFLKLITMSKDDMGMFKEKEIKKFRLNTPVQTVYGRGENLSED